MSDYLIKQFAKLTIAGLIVLVGALHMSAQNNMQPSDAQTEMAQEMLNHLEERELSFEQNKGQLHESIRYQAADRQAVYGFEDGGYKIIVGDVEGKNHFTYSVSFLNKRESSTPMGRGRSVNRSRGAVNYYQEGKGMIPGV